MCWKHFKVCQKYQNLLLCIYAMKDGTRFFWGFHEISEINIFSCTFISFCVICRCWKRHDFGNELCLHCFAAGNMKYIERKTKQFLLGLYSPL